MKTAKLSANKRKSPKEKLVREMYGGEVYEYYERDRRIMGKTILNANDE